MYVSRYRRIHYCTSIHYCNHRQYMIRVRYISIASSTWNNLCSVWPCQSIFWRGCKFEIWLPLLRVFNFRFNNKCEYNCAHEGLRARTISAISDGHFEIQRTYKIDPYNEYDLPPCRLSIYRYSTDGVMSRAFC